MKNLVTIRFAAVCVALLILLNPALSKNSLENLRPKVFENELHTNNLKEPCELKASFVFQVSNCLVYFKDISTHNLSTTITNWYWTFGDGNTSTLQHPVYTYTSSGTYTVCLTIVGNNGDTECKSTICQEVKVECSQRPCEIKASFKALVDKCKVSFTDISTSNPSTTITSWAWNFGDATTSTLQNPTHTYAASGTYSVCLVAYGTTPTGAICKDDTCFKVQVQCEPKPCELKPDFKFNVNGCTVNFTDLSTTNPWTTITNWYWTFGDASSSTLQNPSHTYAASGTYPVCLIIVGTNGVTRCKAEYCTNVTVECGQRPCEVKASFKALIDKCKVSFTDLSTSNPSTTITSWAWNFGDATTSTLQNPTHTYAASGTYSVCLVTYGTTPTGAICKDDTCFKVQVLCEPKPCELKPDFKFNVNGCTVNFTDLSTTNTWTTITNWYWTFGDASSSTLQNPSHTYAASGTYPVCLIIVGTNGVTRCKAEYCLRVTVDCPQRPCEVKADFKFVADGCKVKFTDLSTSNGWTSITGWLWSFGDSSPNSTLQNPTHTYAASGVYFVDLIVYGVTSDGKQCKAIIRYPVQVRCISIDDPADVLSNEVLIAPVPTSDVTNINLKLQKQGRVQIYLVELNTGKQMAEIVNKELETGAHSFTWSPDHSLKNGNYMIIVITPDGISHHKTIYLK